MLIGQHDDDRVGQGQGTAHRKIDSTHQNGDHLGEAGDDHRCVAAEHGADVPAGKKVQSLDRHDDRVEYDGQRQ